jgi:hypothetical protein
MKAYTGNEGVAPLVRNLGTGCRYVVNVKRRPLWPQGWTIVSTGCRGWVGSGASLDYLEKKKILASVVIQTPDRPVRSLATAQATLTRLEKNLNYKFCPYINFSSFLSSPPS